MTIKVLPDEVASQIAAGEVVERPASVIKELVENAIDAQASEITISVEEAGKKLIEVSDNGVGIPEQELELALHRHATSKLESSKDLEKIQSLGFRGEALASIASVSRFTITSRTNQADHAFRLIIEGGKTISFEPVGAPVGTTVRVEDVFYNIPARKKFLKTDNTEKRNIDAWLSRYVVAYPQIRVVLSHDTRQSISTTGQGDAREVLSVLFGLDVAKQMLEVDALYENMTVKGFVSPISLTRSNRNAITFFVNGRWVQDSAMSAALVQAYHSMLMVGRYPLGILFVNMPPDKVDVNVHPAKAEVRFQDSGEVFAGIQRSVKRALLAFSPAPTINSQAVWGNQTNLALGASSTFGQPQFPSPYQKEELSENDAVENSHPNSQSSLDSARMPLLRLVGQIGTSYIVAEGPEGLYLVDQHAAHERILFEKFMAQQNEDKNSSQALLSAETLELPAESSSLMDDQLEMMNKLGFEIEKFGPNTYKVRAIPSLLVGSDPVASVWAVVDDFEEDETPLQDQIEAKIVARVCKRAAVKAGQTLSIEEQKALLEDLEACQAPRTCPHGRPTMIHLSIDLLERQFGRRGAR